MEPRRLSLTSKLSWAGFFFLGVALIMMEWCDNDDIPYLLKKIGSGVGYALTVAAVVSFVRSYTALRKSDLILDLLSKGPYNEFIASDSQFLDKLKGNWHIYHATRLKDGTYAWVYIKLNLILPKEFPRFLTGKATSLFKKKYLFTAADRRGHFILFMRSAREVDQEPHTIAVFKGARDTLERPDILVSGVQYHKTWMRNSMHSISPTILSGKRIKELSSKVKPGTGITSPEDITILERIWKENSQDLSILIPDNNVFNRNDNP